MDAPERRPAPSVRWYRRRLLHLILGLVVAVLAVTWAGQRASRGVLDNLDARLRDGGAGADAALVTVEAEQLSTLRSILFTQGVAQAVATSNPNALNRLVTPLHANSDVPMVDIVRPDGQVLLAVRSKGAPRPAASRRGMPALDQALREARGARGGRFSELVIFKSGPTLVTAGALMEANTPVGVVLVMTPLADVLGRISQQVGADLTAYTADGAPIATTALLNPPTIDPDTARTLIGGGAIVMRYIHGDVREALGRLIVDHQPDAVLGVSLKDDSPATGRAVTLLAALGLIATVILLGTFWARVANAERRE
ncbi:MAG TPA: cache domain-containing protein [Gaiellaceae bacterium]|nr:cache domain-containing protein [Gaiellaceae bacterium]